ncbi:hypothetical protein QUB60_24900 [Microcoleus sp. A2-C5]|uniref:hypothetical protein n=1 Tax=Microcoleaceae TaxID=1892252 RepID=UPI002238BB2C|nr:hypothetical protein [Lyngbya sp. CCAP 1446/10]MCW6051215.1 hypothetical protein [Lyngbya sp. CCAP 1446/10]
MRRYFDLRRKKEEGRRKKEEGRRKKEEGRRKKLCFWARFPIPDSPCFWAQCPMPILLRMEILSYE